MLMTKLTLLGTHAWLCLKFLLWEFSGGPVVETECSHCHGPCSISGCVTKIPQITQLCPREKNGGSERKKHLWSVAAAPEWAFFDRQHLFLTVCPKCGRHGFDPWVGKIPWRRNWQPTPVFLPGKSHGQRSLAGYSPYDRAKSWMWLKRVSIARCRCSGLNYVCQNSFVEVCDPPVLQKVTILR